MRPPCVYCEDGAGKAGKLLKCLHKICLDCLSSRVQQDGRIRCSKCRIPTPRPPPNSSHEQLLVDDSMFDNVAESHDGAKKADATYHNLEFVPTDSVNLVSPQSESTSPDVNRPTEVEGECFHKKIPHRGRVLFCPYHREMEMNYYCTQCRQVLCETCKVEMKHASHIDQISDVNRAAAALRLRLTERMHNIVPDDKEKEVNASLQYAGELLDTFKCDLARRVSNIQARIQEQFQEQILKVKKREEKLVCEEELRQKKLVELQKYFWKMSSTEGALEHILHGTRYALRKQDIIKMHPSLVRRLSATLRDVDAKRRWLLQKPSMSSQKRYELRGHFGVMGKVVDNTDIDLSSCSFSYLGCYTRFAGDELSFTVIVRSGRGQPLPERALKVSSIQIWATPIEGGFSPKDPVLVPISGYSEGEVHALFQYDCSQPAVFLLELLLDTPCPLPASWGSLSRYLVMRCSCFSRFHVYISKAVMFPEQLCTPIGCMRVMPFARFLPRMLTATDLCQVKSGVTTARALGPIEDRDFQVAVVIVSCPFSELDIGLTWDEADYSQEMKLVLASATNTHTPSSPVCDLVAGDIVHIAHSPHTKFTFDILHCSSNDSVKNKHSVSYDPKNKPILMVRMFHCDTHVKVF